jgi:hypothetical protein
LCTSLGARMVGLMPYPQLCRGSPGSESVCWTMMRLMVMFLRERCSRMCKPDVRYWLASGQ